MLRLQALVLSEIVKIKLVHRFCNIKYMYVQNESEVIHEAAPSLLMILILIFMHTTLHHCSGQ